MTDRRVFSGLTALQLIHGALAAGLAANALVISDDSALHLSVGYFCAGVLALWVALDAARLVPSVFRTPGPILKDLSRQIERIATGRAPLLVAPSPIIRAMSWNLLISVGVICLTGWLMTTRLFWASEIVEELHELAVFWTGVSVLGHVGAKVWMHLVRRRDLHQVK